MKSLHDTFKAVEQSAAQKMRQLPGLRQLGAESRAINQSALVDNLGRVALVGDFGYSGSAQLRTDIASRAVKVLQSNNVVQAKWPVDIQSMIPEVAGIDSDYCLNRSAQDLAAAFGRAGAYEATIHEDPIKVGINANNMASSALNVYAGISDVITDRDNDAPERSLLIVTNAFFISQVLKNLRHDSMSAGGVAVLAEPGSRPEENRFVQLWPAAPSISSQQL